ncbi:NAD(P)/FAD-dependent oxidoreductase [Agrococcus sp. Marseille-P2731]|uniref:NAD(P)/FAD-dependent oxidoreductase n=1 Tax=Agrococcus sp. Marseille-P2731 TaxID=1841862 RepID=UPI00092FF8D5|nr:FAD-binding oxidoreductase [Agrococcus sp. Marseille-P2731]
MDAEFVIVGGGVHGLATAYHLALGGAASVTVLEAGVVASGASGGFGERGVRANRRDLRELPLMAEANSLWPTLHEELGAPTGYRRTGGVYLIDGPASTGFKGLDAAEVYAKAHRGLGVVAEVWDRRRVEREYPGISPAVQGASFVQTDGVASHAKTTEAYAQAARRLGVQVVEQTHVADLEVDAAGRVRAVITAQGERIRVGREVLLANNTGVRDLVLAAAGQELPLWSVYPQALRLRSLVAPQIPMLTGHETRPLSVKVLGDELMLSGGWRGRATPAGGVPDEERIRGNIAVLEAVFPYLTGLEVVDADVSRAESASVDQIPIIGRCGPNLSVATGWSGHGWAIAPVVARHLATMLLHDSRSALLAPFSPDRFH